MVLLLSLKCSSLALHAAQAEGRLTGTILLAGFGVGYSWGGVVLECK
ncbi:MAG: 3-oxoacyl-[acyl-carrier-protein] synthase III C-terminal domain-containing protein [Alistipes sp.]